MSGTNTGPREQLEALLKQLVPNATKRARWLDVLRLAQNADAWKAPDGASKWLRPLPTVKTDLLDASLEQLRATKATLGEFERRGNYSDRYFELKRQLEQALSFRGIQL
jgi:hypothetical protein